ncbi:hypothetical protein FQZ97_1044340 [compost metagenome]
MCCTWILTVVSAMSSWRAMCLLLSPRAIRCRISSSRTESEASAASVVATAATGASPWAGGCDRRADTSLVVISGLTTDSPSITLTMASHRWCDSTVLSR